MKRVLFEKCHFLFKKQFHSQLAAIYYYSDNRAVLETDRLLIMCASKTKDWLCVCTHMTNGERTVTNPWDSTNGSRSMTKKNEEVKTTLPRREFYSIF